MVKYSQSVFHLCSEVTVYFHYFDIPYTLSTFICSYRFGQIALAFLFASRYNRRIQKEVLT